MTHLKIYSSEALFMAALICAMAAMLYTYGKEIIKERLAPPTNWSSGVTSKDVTRYFSAQGYTVCTTTPVKNSNKWIAFLVKNGEYLIATVFTKDNKIERHTDSLE